jgi:phosphopantetheinyl transferase
MMTASKNFFFEKVGITDIHRPDKILSNEEMEKYSSFKIPKRKDEWLAGRFAAKTVINKLLDSSFNLKEIPITYDINRRPLCLLKDKKYLLSITHSGDWAAAIVKDEKCSFLGIDIEKIEVRSKYWIEDYFHKDEATDGMPAHLTKLWTIKEAILKALAVGLTVNLLDIKIVDEEIRFFNKVLRHYEEIGKPKFDIISERFSEHYYQTIAVCSNNN